MSASMKRGASYESLLAHGRIAGTALLMTPDPTPLLRSRAFLSVLSIVISAASTALGCTGAEGPTGVTPTQSMVMVAVSPTATTGEVGTEVIPPSVRVTDAAGHPLASVAVSFQVTAGGGGLTPTSPLTDSDGIASVRTWTLGSKAATNTLVARLPRTTSVSFTAVGVAGALTTITSVSGNKQRGFAASLLPESLVVKATDRFGNAVAGASVTFTVTEGGGSIEGGVATTDTAGRASAGRWTLGPTPADQRLTAAAIVGKTEFSAYSSARCGAACPAGRPLAYIVDGYLCIANADGTNAVLLSDERGFSDPAWSPDGRTIAAERSQTTGTGSTRSGIYLMEADGSNLRFFAAGRSAAWSPDGQRIAYSTGSPTGTAIKIGAISSGAPTITVGPETGQNDWPAWSPDGKKLVLVSDWSAYDFAQELYVVNADGSGLAQITNGFFGSVSTWPKYSMYSQPAWSPDGLQLAMIVCTAWESYTCDNSVIGIMQTDGSKIRILAPAGGLARPAWSPDGASVTFARTSWGYSHTAGTFIAPAIGGEARELIAGAHSLAWRR